MVNYSSNKQQTTATRTTTTLQYYFVFAYFFCQFTFHNYRGKMGSAILMQVGKHVGSIPLCASNSIRTITMYYVHVRKIHQSWISATGGILYYSVLQTHWCTCLHYRWSKSDKNISHLQYLYHFHCYDQWCLHRCCHGCLC